MPRSNTLTYFVKSQNIQLNFFILSGTGFGSAPDPPNNPSKIFRRENLQRRPGLGRARSGRDRDRDVCRHPRLDNDVADAAGTVVVQPA